MINSKNDIESKNDIAWKKIFHEHSIIDKIKKNGHTQITATEINKFREARLMTKFDHSSQLPKLFAENQLSILPISRGSYVIGEFQTFCNLNIDDNHDNELAIEFPRVLESLDYSDITSEATAINCAFVSNILRDFTEEEHLFPTVSGRMGSSSFDFLINRLKGKELFKVNVENSQVEIDGGYEGDTSLNLIEAKNYISNDFLIRQLYYPFRLWSSKIKKKVRPIFLTYSNGVFHLREYAFSDENLYNSLVLIKSKKYVFRESSLNLEVVSRIIEETKTVEEPNQVPFPQADNFERIINLCELLKQKDFITKEKITENYDFDKRQTDYYSNAGKYLGLIDTREEPSTKEKRCFLTTRGKELFKLNLIERQKEFIRLIVSHKAFKETIRLYFLDGVMPDKGRIVETMKASQLYNIGSEDTYNRRASTIISWTNWIIRQVEI